MNNLIGALVVCHRAIWSMVLHSDGILWQRERLCDLNHHTIAQKRSQKQTWQVWPWDHKLMSLKPVASQIAMPRQTHLLWEVDQKLGHKSPPAQATLNESMTLYRLIKAKAKQCLTTLPKEDWDMTLLENGKECLISRDEMKVMICQGPHISYCCLCSLRLCNRCRMCGISWKVIFNYVPVILYFVNIQLFTNKSKNS